MTRLVAYPIAFGATLLTTLAVLGLWVLYARIVRGDRLDTELLPLIFLFVPLIFFVSASGNIFGVALGQIAGLAAPGLALWVAVAAAGVLVWVGCGRSQGRLGGLVQGPPPVSTVPVMLFCAADMLILAGGLCLLPANPNS